MSPTPQDAEEALPASVIAHAEAACASNAQEEHALPHTPRRSSQRASTYSYLQDVVQNNLNSRQGASLLRTPSRHSDTLHVDGEAPETPQEHRDELDISMADGFDTKAKVTDDGRVNININQKTRKLSDLLVPALRNQLQLVAAENEDPLPQGYIPPALGGQPGQTRPPKLNVVIQVVGSRGDVQPFVALGKVLKSTYGHRVRLATHPTFQSFVEENGLEFFSIGGDPAELMAFMVKNPGLMPGIDSLKSGDVGKRRKGMEEIVLGCWRSCIETGDGLGAAPRDTSQSILDQLGFEAGINMDASPTEKPFIADAIIANPPSFAHIHVAEKLGIPLHMMFTMPWSPTQSFPHPLANIQSSNADVNMTNYISYALVEMMTWQGLGDILNRFRERVLGLEPVSLIWAPGILNRLKIPYTYCWSPALIPKPKDWGRHINVSGFFFLNLASSYQPEPALAAFLAAGPPPVYIGFGSIVVDDPNAMTTTIFEAVKKAGVRALVSKGWGGLGGESLDVPEGVFMLGNVPHDWLFKHVSAVVHHGGAGTSAAGISLGRPTVVVPFFGDQPWWGAMIHKAEAGPSPIPYKQLTSDKLAAALQEALKPETLSKAQELGSRISQEKGTEVGGKSFHDHLDCDNLRCQLAPSRVAVWSIKKTQTRLSSLAATVLANEGLLDFGDLQLYRAREYETEDGPWDPISGGASALIGTIASLGMGVADFPVEIFRAFKKKDDGKGSKSETSSPRPSSDNNVPESPQAASVISPEDSASRSHSHLNLASLEDQRNQLQSPASSTTLAGTESDVTTHNSMTTPTTIAPSRDSRGDSVKEALGARSSRSRSRSGSPQRKPRKNQSPLTREPEKPFDPSSLTLENATGAAKGISRIVGAGLKSPMDFTLGLARGFHNAPKLYGDDTVRPQVKVTDFQSGLRAAGKEFGYGFYDGITGLVTQPLRGAEKEGTAGLFKGLARGVGGLMLKPAAAIWGLPGYTFMGIHKQIRTMYGSSVQNYIISARTAEGHEQWKAASQEERQDILNHWKQSKGELQKTKLKLQGHGSPEGQAPGSPTPRGFLQTRHLSFDERKKLHEDRKGKRKLDGGKSYGGAAGVKCPFCANPASHHHEDDYTPSSSTAETSVAEQMIPQIVEPADEEEFEKAIKASVKATSKGNPEEDAVIERAIRASVRELQTHQTQLTEEEAFQRAIKASIAEAGRNDLDGASDSERAAILETAIHKSITETKVSNVEEGKDASAIQMRDDDQSDDEELRRAIADSRAHHDEIARAKTEEDIVMEYIKKQSLAEEEHRKAMQNQS